ncbi:MAG TPA: hypothetical protein VMR18_00450 [Candidatus Saccharimonadales bacterium]|nr:hypothetical protein [Candidatus Saccharimonadales bacterium]
MTAIPESVSPVASGPEYTGPTVEFDLGEETFSLTWGDTVLRTFFLEEGEYDHILHSLPDGRFIAFSIKMLGLEEVKELLIEKNYTQKKSPTLDQPTIDWYVRMQAREIDAEFELPLS